MAVVDGDGEGVVLLFGGGRVGGGVVPRGGVGGVGEGAIGVDSDGAAQSGGDLGERREADRVAVGVGDRRLQGAGEHPGGRVGGAARIAAAKGGVGVDGVDRDADCDLLGAAPAVVDGDDDLVRPGMTGHGGVVAHLERRGVGEGSRIVGAEVHTGVVGGEA